MIKKLLPMVFMSVLVFGVMTFIAPKQASACSLSMEDCDFIDSVVGEDFAYAEANVEGSRCPHLTTILIELKVMRYNEWESVEDGLEWFVVYEQYMVGMINYACGEVFVEAYYYGCVACFADGHSSAHRKTSPQVLNPVDVKRRK